MPKKLDINPQEFMTWLAAQPEMRAFRRDYTYEGGWSCNCPIACFLRETRGLSYASVGSYSATTSPNLDFAALRDMQGDAKVDQWEMPGWAEDFIMHFDHDARNINPIDALNIMVEKLGYDRSPKTKVQGTQV